MFTCPHCNVTLIRRKSPSLGLVWVCPSCKGRAMTLEMLRKAVPQPLVNRLWQRARSGEHETIRSCPACKRRMAEVPIALPAGRTLHLDVCTGCHFVWFDPQEFESLPKCPPKPISNDDALPPKAREALALAKLDALNQQQSALSMQADDGPESWWQFVIAMCGIPVEYNDVPLKNRPVVTWLLAAAITIVSLLAFMDLEPIVKEWGMIPAEFTRHFGLTFVTSFFLHGGLFHLIGNLCFLIIFGDNAEDILGKGRYLLLVVAAAIVGDIAHIMADPRAAVPCIGASGGISGILAYYCLRFPKASVGIIYWFRWFRLPVGILFALWVLTQITDAFWISGGNSNVAVFAHLGGAAVGVLFWLWTHRLPSTDAAPSLTQPAKTP